jgi:DNA-binding response OmpR family regulator
VTTRGSTIAIVEESAAVQELVDQALRGSGDHVLVTQNALEVLDVARRVRIDLLVIDIDSQPGLVEEIRESQPDLQVLYLSDSTDERRAGTAQPVAAHTVLARRASSGDCGSARSVRTRG